MVNEGNSSESIDDVRIQRPNVIKMEKKQTVRSSHAMAQPATTLIRRLPCSLETQSRAGDVRTGRTQGGENEFIDKSVMIE